MRSSFDAPGVMICESPSAETSGRLDGKEFGSPSAGLSTFGASVVTVHALPSAEKVSGLMKKGGGNKISTVGVSPCAYTDVRLKDGVPSSSTEAFSAGRVAAFDKDLGWGSTYTLTKGATVTISLDTLVLPDAPASPVPLAATADIGPASGESPARPNDVWEFYVPGVACMDKVDDEGLWETVILEEVKVKEKEMGKEKGKEHGQLGSEADTKETAEDQVEKEPRVVPPLWEWVPLEGEEKEVEQKGDEKENEEKEKMEGKVRRRKACSGFLSASEKAWARAREINRSLRPLLFPGLRKRKYNSLLFGLDLRTIERANAERLKAEKKKEEMKEKEKEEKEMKEKMGKPDLFVFGRSEEEKEKEKDPKIFVFGSAGNSEMEKVTYYGKVAEETGSEIYFKGGVVAQVGEEESVPEPEKIQVLHRVGGVLKVVDLRLEQKLGDLFGEGFLLHGELAEEGYFATLGGRLLDSNKSVANLGLQQGQEVVFHRRLRGGGFSGGGKGAREGRANSVAAGDWTCGICHQPGCWNARSTCYRCGAPRYQSQGLSGQANSGARDMEGRYQSGVGTGMGGYRVIGPNGRDQSYIPGGNPTQRKGPQPGGKGRNKVGGDTGAGVGVGFGTGGGVVGGGGGGDNRSAFSWLGGGGGVGNPLPPGIVPSERDQAQFCVEHLKGLLKDERDLEEFSNFWEGRLPAKPVPAPVKTPTEAQRAEVFAQLTKRQDGLARRVKDGQGRVEVAKAKVRQEEAAVEELERELKVVSDQVDAHRAENLRRAEEAKAPRVDEVGSDMDLEAGSSSGGEFGVNQVAGKRRKVVRKNRFQGNKLTKEELWQFFSGMPNPDRDWFKRQFLGDVGSGVGCTDHTLAGDVVEPDKVELNARASLAPTQEEVAETPCG